MAGLLPVAVDDHRPVVAIVVTIMIATLLDHHGIAIPVVTLPDHFSIAIPITVAVAPHSNGVTCFELPLRGESLAA